MAPKEKTDHCATTATRRATLQQCARTRPKIKATEEKGRESASKAPAPIHRKERPGGKENPIPSLAWATSRLAKQTQDGPKGPGT